jgi:RHS repeat-associated protein
MQLASSARLPDGLLAAQWLGAEKPHQGVSTQKQAWHPAPSVCNSTTALGLRAGCAGNRVRSFCSGEQYDSDLSLYYLRARYYNPATGRFLSRDPYDGDAKIPATLHKYLYAGGDPVNLKDPTGRDWLEYKLLIKELGPPAATGLMIAANVICGELAVVAFVLDGSHWLNPNSPGLPWPVKAPCAAYGIAKGAYAAWMALFAML